MPGLGPVFGGSSLSAEQRLGTFGDPPRTLANQALSSQLRQAEPAFPDACKEML